MTYMQVSINAWSLGIKTNVHILMPDLAAGEAVPSCGYPALYLLHGYMGDGSDWIRLSRLEYYLAKKKLIVIMPDGYNGFYTNTASGDAYWTYLCEELPSFVQGYLPVSRLREHNFTAGLSMGGYGAIKLALRRPTRFSHAVSLSGALDMLAVMELLERTPNLIPDCNIPPHFDAIFGTKANFAASKDNLLQLLENIAPDHCPKLGLWCGDQDFLLDVNKSFAELAQKQGLPCSLRQFSGGHEWNFWDTALQRMLEWLPLHDKALAH